MQVQAFRRRFGRKRVGNLDVAAVNNDLQRPLWRGAKVCIGKQGAGRAAGRSGWEGGRVGVGVGLGGWEWPVAQLGC